MSTTNILDLNNRIDELEKNSGGGSSDSAKRSDIATEFSTETSYTAGNFVYHEGKLYQFNADHSAGAWDPTDVVEANVTDQIVSNASAIAGLTASDVAYDNTDSGLTATDLQGAVDEVVEKMCNVKISELWENSDPTSIMAAGTDIILSDAETNYDLLLVLCKMINTASYSYSVIGAVGSIIISSCFSGSNSYTRQINYVDSTHRTAGAGWIGGTQDTSASIPVKIFGIKLL